jgi:hypothetical protein
VVAVVAFTPTETAAVPDTTVVVQLAVTLAEPEITFTLAVLAPKVEYFFKTEGPVPAKASVPDQLYVYTPVPPEGITYQVTLPPSEILVEDGQQTADRLVVAACTDPKLFITKKESARIKKTEMMVVVNKTCEDLFFIKIIISNKDLIKPLLL